MKNLIFCAVNEKAFKSLHLNFMGIIFLSTIVDKFQTQKFVKY